MGDDEVRGPGRSSSDPYKVAREIALRQLTVRARTRVELARVLARKQVPEDVAESVLDRFTEVGLVDDAAFARDWVALRATSTAQEPRVLLGELAEKGVDAGPDRRGRWRARGRTRLRGGRGCAAPQGHGARRARPAPVQVPAAVRRSAGAPGVLLASVVAQVTREVLAEARGLRLRSLDRLLAIGPWVAPNLPSGYAADPTL